MDIAGLLFDSAFPVFSRRPRLARSPRLCDIGRSSLLAFVAAARQLACVVAWNGWPTSSACSRRSWWVYAWDAAVDACERRP